MLPISKVAAATCGLLLAGVGAARAQVPPPPAQAAQALQSAVANNPGMANTIQARIAQSGLSPDQVRSRLQAAGYAPNLLDAYMGDSATVANAQLTPGAQETSAIEALGLPALVRTDTITTKTGVVVQPTAPALVAGLPVFGVDVFKRSTTQFYPLLSGPVPPDYKLGPGDQLVLILTGDVELTYQLPITREGFVLIPQVGQVFLSNLTLDQARDVLYTRLGRVYSGVKRGAGATTKFDISVANVRAVQVYVVGEVAQPGAYQISALGTVLTGLYAAGGVTGLASGRQIDVRRHGKSIATFDLYDYLLKGDTRSDIRLEDGDVIFVPVKSRRVAITGSINRPAQYDLAPNETLTDLVRESGGLTADAAATRISITRIVPPAQRGPGGAQRVVVDVPMGNAATDVPPVPMEDGDSVAVFTITDAVHHYVDLTGSVYLPGRFGWHEGLRLSDVVKLAGGLRPATFAGRAHISRWNPADSTRYLISVELPKDSAAPWPADSLLRDRDAVTIYGRPEMRDSIEVAITGAVNQPGRFPYRQGMTLRDLVLMAHGTKPGAFLDYAEIARLPADRKGGVLATTIRVPLDSTYLFDRDSLGRYVGPPGLAFKPSGAPEIPIEPYDNVLIFRQPGFELQRTVTIQGQVRFPGTYALQRKDERVTSLLERAGGLTGQAYPEGVRFYRPFDNAGRVDIDLPNAIKHPESRDNVILQPGDTIIVPEYEAVVKVTGAVNSPGSVLWKKGASLSYYVSAAGGYSQKADEKHTSVRQANGEIATRSGKFLFWGGGVKSPDPGAEVSVPFKDPNAPHTDAVALFGGIAQVLASTLTLIFVATKL
jgi:protein involved in polysaccharide export with SLBB domain